MSNSDSRGAQQQDRTNHSVPSIILVLFILAVTVFIGFSVINTVTDQDFQQYIEDSEEWCEQRDGKLVNVQSISHGGLHCDLPNGESVHMSEVIDRG